MKSYREFIESKMLLAPKTGFDLLAENVNGMLFPHQKDIARWAVRGGRRGIFARFGLGKTFMELEISKAVKAETGRDALIVCPLGVKREFFADAAKLGIKLAYVRNTEEAITTVPDGIRHLRIAEAKQTLPDLFELLAEATAVLDMASENEKKSIHG